MSFLNPILLLGLTAVSVPIVIHLLNRRKFQKVVWGAMRFLQTSVERNQRRMRMEDLILLALRCLLVGLLALALARPAAKSLGAASSGKVTGVILLDNSFSMGASDGAATRFDKARQTAEQALDSLPPGSAAAVFLASDVVRPVIPEPTFDLNLVRKTIREAPLSDHATDLFAALDKAVETLQGRRALRKEVFLVTDGQAAGWRQLGEIQGVLERSKADIKTRIILVDDQEDHNLGISDLRLAGGLAPVKQPLRFEVRVGNYGKEEVRDLPVTLSVDGERPVDEFTISALPPGASKSISLFAKFMTDGYHSVTARLPDDRLRADDRRAIVVRAIKEFRVLLVDGNPGNEPRESEVFFLRNALVPVSPDLAEDYFIKTATITFADLSTARFDHYDAVVLANVAEFSEAALKALEEYVRRGGGLVVFPGARVNTAFYNERLFQRDQFLPAGLGALRGQAGQDQDFFALQDKNYQHGIVSIWNDPAAGTLASARFFQAFALLPPTPAAPSDARGATSRDQAPRDAGEPQIVIQYADGAPAVMERPWGLGRVILFSSTASTTWNDWPVRPSFVPLVHRTLGAILQRQDETLNLRVGAKFSRQVNPEYLDKEAAFSRPGDPEAARDLRRVELANGWPVVQYEATDLAGVYEAGIADPPLTLKFAAQPDPAESNLDPLSPAQRDLLRGAAQVVEWRPNLAMKEWVTKDRAGFEFWLPLLAAVLLLAALETYLAQRFSLEK